MLGAGQGHDPGGGQQGGQGVDVGMREEALLADHDEQEGRRSGVGERPGVGRVAPLLREPLDGRPDLRVHVLPGERRARPVEAHARQRRLARAVAGKGEQRGQIRARRAADQGDGQLAEQPPQAVVAVGHVGRHLRQPPAHPVSERRAHCAPARRRAHPFVPLLPGAACPAAAVHEAEGVRRAHPRRFQQVEAASLGGNRVVRQAHDLHDAPRVWWNGSSEDRS
ncbi:hypothetical protein GCM10010412_061620 [Nonomuraea recticatena]|uniref:Uncharacterized protein n=1 Tax=Nonomuraea recticatena TaxID=46178 RepID=A0ABN3SJ35_9ACTN